MHERALSLADELDAFGGAGGALVELTRQRLHREDRGAADAFVVQAGIGGVALRFAEDGVRTGLEELFARTLYIVAVHQAQPLEGGDSQDAPQLVQELLRLHVESGLLFHVDAGDHRRFLSVRSLSVCAMVHRPRPSCEL